MRAAAVRALWSVPCVSLSTSAPEECVLPSEEAASAVEEANHKEMAARGIDEVDADGRPLYTFTIASAALGGHSPKTWRLAAHSLADAEAWAAALETMAATHDEAHEEPADEHGHGHEPA